MGQKVLLFPLLVFMPILVIAETNLQDFLGLQSVKDIWENTPPSWVSSDPCGDWEGIRCNNSRVTSIKLSSMGLKGSLSDEIQKLSELQTLDLSYNKGLTGSLPQSIGNLKNLSNLILVGCSFSGPLPDTIGSSQQLVFLSLNSNRFSGRIPPSIGKLSKLYWLDIADNNFEGTIPVSTESTPGLDMLLHTKHFHFGKNKLSGKIPDKLFSSNMELIHVLFESNELTGPIPSTLGLVQNLEVVRLDRNKLNGKVPSNLKYLTNCTELYLSNNKLSGPVPNITGMNLLRYVDMSNNSFDASDVPAWFSTLQSLTTLMMESTHIQGELPVSLFSLPNLQTVVLKNNSLNGTLDIGTTYNNQLQLIDLQNNLITVYRKSNREYNVKLILADNPVCQETGMGTESYCKVSDSQSNNSIPYSTPLNNCVPSPCSSDKNSSPNCKCAYPYTGILEFRTLSFANLENSSYYKDLEKDIWNYFQLHGLLLDSVSLSNPTKDLNEYLQIRFKVFPFGQDRFNRTETSGIGSLLSNQTFKPNKYFGSFVFHGDEYENYEVLPTGSDKSSKSSIGIIIGAAAGGCVLVLFLLLAGVYAFYQKRRAERSSEQSNPFVHWDSNKNSGGVPLLKGARWFSYEELKKYTNNFSVANEIGSGGYGKVYRGSLATGELLAIKKAEKESRQGGLEFKTEIELLSRVHHKNLVSLVGFCFERGEQMLVYEYLPNGSLKDSLSGRSGIWLDWMRRLKVSLGTAKGLAYLHELANPPIIHRDIKSTNVLLDDHLNAKVADFGVSKLMGEDDKDHVTSQVKGTMGYLDPEYYMSQQLTEKSDVYSFGVLMLELITARGPIERGKYIVREVEKAIDKTQDLYNLHGIIDSSIGLGTKLIGFEKFVDLALRCVEAVGADRPTMSEVVKEIEAIMQLAGLNPNAESASTSASYEEVSKPTSPYAFDYSGAFPPSKIEPQ